MHQPPVDYSAPHGPPQWAQYSKYGPGVTVQYGGTLWRCEAAHTSGPASSGAPTTNLHLWTPVSSNGYYPAPSHYPYYSSGLPQQYPAQPPSYAPYPSFVPNGYAASPSYSAYPVNYQDYYAAPPSGSQSQQSAYRSPPHILAPQPLSMPNRPPSPSSFAATPAYKHEDDSSPDSQGTVTANDRGMTEKGGWGMEELQEKAAGGLRFVTQKEEAHKARDADELKDELRGKRVWRTGGIGIWAYALEEKLEEAKKKVWRDWSEKHSKDEWIRAARARTEAYNRESRGVKPVVMWKLVERGGHLPDDALPVGHEADGSLLYAARAWWEGGLHLGKAGAHLVNSASLSYGGDEHSLDIYEVLCGPADPTVLRWMTFDHGANAHVGGWQPVEGGREKDGNALLVAKGEYENGVHPGKVLVNDDHACVGYGGGELWVRPFQILAYATTDRR